MAPSPAGWQRLEPLLDAALDLPADQRAAFLDSACAGDAELRAEVERLLRACAESRHFLQEPAEAYAAPILASLASDLDPAGPAASGTRIGPYRIIEEAGRGGMAVVYLAERDDGEFRMRVALKLVRAGVIPEDELLRRFREERQILADLEHPGIARLLDGGVTEDGVPWFALEYVDGTPIEHYCDERRLSVEARLELFCAVCDAVQHAHARRIVHRDLKPGNILVTEPDGEEGEEGRVKLLDFGIAKLLAAPRASEPAEQTRPGLRLLTPEYASPEQVRGEAVTPAADVYALGVLLYRLLCGRHPYRLTGRSVEGIGQRVLDTQPEPPSAAVSRAPEAGVEERGEPASEAVAGARSTGPEQLSRRLQGDLDAIVLETLSKQPEQRYASAGELGAEVRRHLRGARVKARQGAQRRRAVLTLGAAMLILALALAAWFARDEGTATAIDPEVIVVAPFHVAADGSFDYLSEGLVDLLATSLNGETGSRAVDPRAAIAAWRTAIRYEGENVSLPSAQAIARGLGAGQLLMGSLVGTPARLTLNATLFDTVREAVLIRISVHGSEDSLQTLIDAVVGQLLAREAEVPRHQLAAVTTTSLPALRSYLAGRRSYRFGHFGEAVQRLEEALSHDSTFALAATHLWLAVGVGPLTAAPGTRERALGLAWAGRDRLSKPDRLFLEAIAGPRYPEPTPRHELLAAYTRAVNASPDRPEVLRLMGAFLLGGVLRDEEDAQQRAAEYFSRALALDSSYASPAYNLVREAAVAGDRATVHRIVRRYLATDSASEMAHLLAWIEAAVSGDQREVLDIRARMPAMHPTALGWIVLHALLFGRDMDGAGAALAALRATVRSEHEWANHRFREWEYLGNRGRLAELRSRLEKAARETEGFGPIEELGLSAEHRARGQRAVYLVRTALFWGGDTTGVGEAITLLEDLYRRSPAPTGETFARLGEADAVMEDSYRRSPAATGERLAVLVDGACFAGMGRIAEGDIARARPAAVRLQHLLDGGLEFPNRTHYALCAAMLDALVAVAAGSPDARRRVERADSLLRHDAPQRLVMSGTQLLLARAFDALGDPEAGLRTIRRRQPNNPAFFLASILAEEGRLATRVGDHEGAIRAYRHYLVLRTHPDPALVPEVERIRSELARLLADR
jgi:serine/threonine protein kinase/tetratricopeptide (TPR) repeat protein